MTKAREKSEVGLGAAEGARQFLRSLLDDTLGRVDVRRQMAECFVVESDVLRVNGTELPLGAIAQLKVVAIGKAAIAMVEPVMASLGGRLPVEGVVVGRGDWSAPQGIAYYCGGHPVPDESSFAAAHACLRLVQSADASTLVLFLISGGASAMAEAPLDATLPWKDMTAFYAALLHSGLPIAATNAMRKHFSLIKGGRLAQACAGSTRWTLLVSDVPPGREDVIGSGPSLPDPSTVEECRRLWRETPVFRRLSPRMERFLDEMPETPKVLPDGAHASLCFTALSSDSMLEIASSIAKMAGYRVICDNGCDDWEYAAAAQYLLDGALRAAEQGLPVCVLSAGEVTVEIPGRAGVGGRNQQWALEMARLIAGREGVAAMSVGSDGVDGNSPAAGAIVDGSTWGRAQRLGCDPQQALDAFDAYPLLAALGDAIVIGATGNNLRDLRVVLVRG